jgi:4-amino-4-deoxy-L-arabinose transferase-like glycosyltransferase
MNNFLLKRLPLLVIIAFSALLWIPNFFTRGVFIDGLLYGLIGNNLAQGYGSLWSVQGIPAVDSQLWGNPPFHIWMLSFFYSLFGNHFWVDHLYSLVTAIITLLLIFFCAKAIAVIENKKNDKWWLPCIACLLFLPVSWIYSSNVMETTMTIFTTLSFLFLLQYICTKKRLVLFALLSSCCIFIAFITKGLPSFFLFVAPLCLLSPKAFFSWRKALNYSIIQLIGFTGLFLLVFSQPGPSVFLHHYIDIQLVPVLKQQYSTTGSRFFIVFELLKAIIFPLLMLGAFMIFQRGRGSTAPVSRISYGILLLALLASLPIIISLKQSTFYLVPSLPLFALFFGNVMSPYVERIKLSLLVQKLIAGLSIVTLVIVVVICVARVGTYGREIAMQKDIEKIAGLLGNEKIISSGNEIYTEWSLKIYMYRDYKITDETLSDSNQHLFLLKKIGVDSTPAVYHSVYKGEIFELFKKQNIRKIKLSE